jgi:hypothetical protein
VLSCCARCTLFVLTLSAHATFLLNLGGVNAGIKAILLLFATLIPSRGLRQRSAAFPQFNQRVGQQRLRNPLTYQETRRTLNQRVEGSSPPEPTIRSMS